MADVDKGMSFQKIDGFLKVPDVTGPSERGGHTEEIECHGMTIRIDTPTHTSAGRTSGRAVISALTVVKYVDATTPLLFQFQLTNKKLDPVLFTVRRVVDNTPTDYFQIQLENARVVGLQYRPSAEAPDLLEEYVDLGFQKITFTHNPEGITYTHDIFLDQA